MSEKDDIHCWLWSVDTSCVRDFFVIDRIDLIFKTTGQDERLMFPVGILQEFPVLVKHEEFMKQAVLDLVLETKEKYFDDFKHAKKLSLTDKSSLIRGSQMRAGIYSGDKLQRKEAEKRGLPVRGSLWILSKAVEKQLITTDEAQDLHAKMLSLGRRLPEKVFF